jgi:hypothetical protein
MKSADSLSSLQRDLGGIGGGYPLGDPYPKGTWKGEKPTSAPQRDARRKRLRAALDKVMDSLERRKGRKA